MPRPKKVQKVRAVKSKPKEVIIDKVEQDYQNNLKCIKLISQIRKQKDEKLANAAFEELLSMLIAKINKVVSRFRIPGNEHNDVLQEALYALRYKAIKDYDKERGNGTGPAPFDKFALLCIRRHLATEFKSSYQNRRRVLNQASSIYANTTGNRDDDDVSLVNIIPDPNNGDVGRKVAENEYYSDLQTMLFESLSNFEKEVYRLYAQKYSYEEIAEKINSRRKKVMVKIKGVDNALSRIKHKARDIFKKYEKKLKD